MTPDWNKLMTGSSTELAPPEEPTAGWKPDPADPGQFRYWDGEAWEDRTTGPEQSEPMTEKPASPLTEILPILILTFIAGTLILIGQVTPMYESVAYREILKNTLIQQDLGWLLVAGAGVLALAALFSRRLTTLAWCGILVGLTAVTIAAVAGLSEDMRTLTSAIPGDRHGHEETAVAAIGIYLTAIGGAAAIVAGISAFWTDAGRRT